MHGRNPGTKKNAFSLIELVIVLAILAVITAIAIPRMTRGAENADVTGLQGDLAALRSAIELYKLDHNTYPTLAAFTDQLTKQTDVLGAPGTDYGPYLVSIPALKLGTDKGSRVVAAPAAVPPIAEVAGAGWLYGRPKRHDLRERNRPLRQVTR